MCAANTTVGPPPVPLRTPLTFEIVSDADVGQPELLHFGRDVRGARLFLVRRRRDLHQLDPLVDDRGGPGVNGLERLLDVGAFSSDG